MKWIVAVLIAAYIVTTQYQPVDQTLCIAKLGFMETTSDSLRTKIAIAMIMRSASQGAGLPPCQVVTLDRGNYLSSYKAAISKPKSWNGVVWSESREEFLKRDGADSSYMAAELVLNSNLYTAVYHFDACTGKASWKKNLVADSYGGGTCFYHKSQGVLDDLRYKVSLIK